MTTVWIVLFLIWGIGAGIKAEEDREKEAMKDPLTYIDYLIEKGRRG